MKPVIYKARGLILKNPSPLLMAILRVQKLMEPYIRAKIKKTLADQGKGIDKLFMEMGNGHKNHQ